MFALSYFALGGWISCSNRAVTLLLWKGIVARLKRSNLYPTGLFCCSYIFFQSSHCSSSESTKPHTLDANTKVTCSWLCSLSKIIIENILVDPQQLTSALKIIYRSYLLWLGSKDTGVLFYRSWEGLEKLKDPSSEGNYQGAYHWWQNYHARKPLGHQGRKGQVLDLKVPSITSEERCMNCRLEKISVCLSGAIIYPCE